MAFGYLGRSRPEGDKTNYTRQSGSEKEASSDPASSTADDAAQENSQEPDPPEPSRPTDTSTDVVDIPDPADPRFNDGITPVNAGMPPTTTAAIQEEASHEGAEADQNRSLPTEETAAVPDGSGSTATVAAVASTPIANPQPPSSVASSHELDTPAPPNRMIILAVPLLAGALLMGLFWLILKSGSA
jgi:hypothetical protein